MVRIMLAILLFASLFLPSTGWCFGPSLGGHAVEVVSGSSPNIDFTTFETETDPDGAISTDSASQITVTTLDRQAAAYLYKDYTADYFGGDFVVRGVINQSVLSSIGYALFFALANDIEDNKAAKDGGSDRISIGFYGATILISVTENGTDNNDTASISTSTDYYWTLTRDDDGGTNSTGLLTLNIRTGSHTGTEISGSPLLLSCKVGEQNDFRYLYAVSSYNDGSSASNTVSFVNSDMELNP